MTLKKSGGIEKTLVYWLAVEISSLTHIFINRYISRGSRTFDQMEQASRSGKQNLVEGSLEKIFLKKDKNINRNSNNLSTGASVFLLWSFGLTNVVVSIGTVTTLQYTPGVDNN